MGQDVCTQVGSGRAGRVCSLVEQQVQAWPGGQRGTDWSLMVGGPCDWGVGWIYTFPIGMGGFDFEDAPTGVLALGSS